MRLVVFSSSFILAVVACSGDEEESALTPTPPMATAGSGAAAGSGTTSAGGAGQGGSGGAMACDDLNDCVGCNTCALADPCVSVNETCDANQACLDYTQCIGACDPPSDTACRDACGASFPDGVDDYDALFTCICGTCTNSCGMNPLCNFGAGGGGASGSGGSN